MKPTHCYDDIITLPHPVSATHPPMPMAERAAQFSPFAALTGFEDAIRERGRLTDSRAELSEDARALLDEKLRLLTQRRDEPAKAAVTCFRPYERKDGGAYVTITGRVKRVDAYAGLLVMQSGEKIPLEDIWDIEL